VEVGVIFTTDSQNAALCEIFPREPFEREYAREAVIGRLCSDLSCGLVGVVSLPLGLFVRRDRDATQTAGLVPI
jgi:hypothetical protein